MHPTWKKLAVFGHFENVARDAGEANTDTIIVRLQNKWFWIIPLSAEKTSVGLVIDKDEFAKSGGSPEEIFQRWIESSPPVKERMKNARRFGDLQTTSDFSYYNRKFTGDRLLRVGDAAGFMDPIFSAGVFLAMWSGKIAAGGRPKIPRARPAKPPAVCQLRKARPQGPDVLLARGGELLHHAVHGIFFAADAITAICPPPSTPCWPAKLEGGWKLRWRLKYFFLLVKIQKRWPLVPHLPFLRRHLKQSQTSESAVKA